MANFIYNEGKKRMARSNRMAKNEKGEYTEVPISVYFPVEPPTRNPAEHQRKIAALQAVVTFLLDHVTPEQAEEAVAIYVYANANPLRKALMALNAHTSRAMMHLGLGFGKVSPAAVRGAAQKDFEKMRAAVQGAKAGEGRIVMHTSVDDGE